MKSGYSVFWSDLASNELQETLQYLEENFSEKELVRLSNELEQILSLISINPKLFPSSSKKKNIRKIIILTYNTMYYKVSNNSIEIISFFSNRQKPRNQFDDK